MPTAPFWEEDPGAWETLVIAGRPLPGIARVTGRAGRKVDVRSPPGADGARVRDRGYEPAPIEIELIVWTKAQLEELETRLEELHPRGANPPPRDRAQQAYARLVHGTAVAPVLLQQPEILERLQTLSRQAEAERRANSTIGRRTPVDVIHPGLALLGIRSVYVTGVSVPELRNGQLVTTLSVLEWTPAPTPAPHPAKGSAGAGGRELQDAFTLSRNQARPQPTPPARVSRS